MLTDALRSIYTTNLGIKKSERVLVFTDRMRESELLNALERCRRERLRDIALLTAEIGKTFSKKVMYHEYDATGSHGAEPPEKLWELSFGDKTVTELRKAGLLEPLLNKNTVDGETREIESIVREHRKSSVNAIIALSNFSTSHTRFRDLLIRVCKARYASMPLFDVSMLETAMDVDWKALAKRTNSITRAVNRYEAVEIRTPNGTLLKLSKSGRKAHSDTGLLTRPGSFGNLPAGEVYLAPLEGTANGRLVLEWAPTRELASPITLIIKKGAVVEVLGNEIYAEYLKSKINERSENANIAELGIGTNNKARRPDNILESEKILGTIHIALGDNSSFGGKVKTPFHQDFIFFRPTVVLIHKDGSKKALMKGGRLL